MYIEKESDSDVSKYLLGPTGLYCIGKDKGGLEGLNNT